MGIPARLDGARFERLGQLVLARFLLRLVSLMAGALPVAARHRKRGRERKSPFMRSAARDALVAPVIFPMKRAA
jgi:hypothetical protein